MKTYDEWLLEGRVPAAGQKARFFRTNEARTVGLALFERDQTTEIGTREREHPDAVIVIPRAEWEEAKRRMKAQPKRPKVHVRATEDGLSVWVGNNRKLIDFLKEKHWRFDRAANRWRLKTTMTVEDFVRIWTEAGADVEVDAA